MMLMASNKRYAVACRTNWFWERWREQEPNGEWLEIHRSDELDFETLKAFEPRYIFFPHWSTLVGDDIVDRFECVCFHAAPVPFGRGGSPIQNMIVRGHQETELVALRMTDVLDGGPVYLRHPMSLLGGGDEIYLRLADHTVEMIEQIVANEPESEEQRGEVTVFKRRQPHQSELPDDATLSELFDFIRMLDAEGYPNAFVEYGGLRIEFSRPVLRRGLIETDVVIKPTPDSSE
jgi:methionyl-tRNA formyltransferase